MKLYQTVFFASSKNKPLPKIPIMTKEQIEANKRDVLSATTALEDIHNERLGESALKDFFIKSSKPLPKKEDVKPRSKLHFGNNTDQFLEDMKSTHKANLDGAEKTQDKKTAYKNLLPLYISQMDYYRNPITKSFDGMNLTPQQKIYLNLLHVQKQEIIDKHNNS